MIYDHLNVRLHGQLTVRKSTVLTFVNLSDDQRFPSRDLPKNLRFTNPDLQRLLKNMKDYPVILEISKDFLTKICKNFSDFPRFPK